MDLDPVDIFGETIGGPIKRGLLFLAAMVAGGWIGEISAEIDAGGWGILGWYEIGMGFIWPLGVLFSSAAPLAVVLLVVYVITTSWAEWIWCAVAAGTSAVVLHFYAAGTGWLAWFALNAGLAGVVWVHLTWRRARWAKELCELNAENAIRNRMRQEKPLEAPQCLATSDDPGTDPESRG
jgi:hypothetical protein